MPNLCYYSNYHKSCEVQIMKRILFTVPSVLVLIFSVILPAISISKVQAASQITPNYIVSQGAPAYTNSGCNAAGGNDNNYSTYWSSCSTPSSSNPQFLAYDLSDRKRFLARTRL